MTDAQTAERKTYHGNCHCQAIKFTVTIPEIKTLYACNCSQCVRLSARFAPYTEEDIKFEKGKDALVDYQFGLKTNVWQLCPKCGITVGFIGPTLRALNARTFENFDLTVPSIVNFDGAAKPPNYEPHAHTGPQPKAEEGERIYTGGCHCGSVTVAFAAGDLSQQMIVECDCSICNRNGHKSIYLSPDKVCIHAANPDADISYEFAKKRMTRFSCNKCGVFVGGVIKPLPAEVLAAMPEQQRAMASMFVDKKVVNLNVVHGIEVDKLPVKKFSQKDAEPKYVVA